ncbi:MULTISPECIES: hypothetical protein [Fusobacterium]|jgi:hypothetical protein|uniref:Uncharacterized protein n=4 Tax=Fusobacterium TaxID=848 RepID=K1GW78_9FUSO|nr:MULTISPECIES: hypothetical protein [Fusobacterium]ATV71182.1 hypothetical protein CTM98_11295 [Fusobacterium pseudoperiodonticum]AVQ25528.1 hypothetical protein C4N17_07400 [Fusobacterium periodonticum]EKA93637.1 hypothetical protein FPOG_01035 [Fusobacterium periodonticum D10]KGE62078.1 hypothetical protein FSAG_001823 [Fusobacterium periodonticum 2_1_31]MBF1192040.1 hypothetical protein [Fusobacterium periodonticum]
MAKKFITLKDVEQQISNGKIYLDEKAILASSLQDYIREHNIEVVYGGETCSVKPSVADCACLKEEVAATSSKAEDFTEVARLIVKILKNDYGIQDEEKIMQVIKIIREVLK